MRQPSPTQQALLDLAEKYRCMVPMRQARETLEQAGILRFEGDDLQDRRRASRALAQRFPGALRELDVCDASLLEQRLVDVEAECAEMRATGRAVPSRLWVRMMLDFHALLREGLAIKAWLRLRRDLVREPSYDIVQAFRTDFAGLTQRVTPMEHADVEFLQTYRKSSGYRLMTVVWRRLAERHGLDASTAQAVILPKRSDRGQSTRHDEFSLK
ncbi:MAG: hypothetical protein R3C68_19040 [Myxococcota bacterium]